MWYLNAKLLEPCFHLWQHGVLNCLIWAWMSSHIVLTGLFSFHTLQPAVTGPQRGRVKRIWTAILGARAGRLAWARAQTSRLRASSPLNTQRETSEMPFRRRSLHIAAARRPKPLARPLASWNSSIRWKNSQTTRTNSGMRLVRKGNSWF